MSRINIDESFSRVKLSILLVIILLGQVSFLSLKAGAVSLEERILFTNQTGEIASILPDGTDMHTVTSGTQVQISPNGQKISFNRNGHIYVSNVDGTSERNITADLPNANRYPSWSPGGTKILFTSGRSVGNGLYTRDLSGGSEQLIMLDMYDGRYSPDGAQIVHQCVILGLEEICISDSNGSNTLAVTDESTWGDRFPNWSPDGSRIVFRSQSPGGPTNISTINSDGSNMTIIYSAVTGGGVDEPSWSPDSARVVFTNYHPPSGLPFVYRLFVMDAVPGAQAQDILPVGSSHPVWGVLDNDIPPNTEPQTFSVISDADTYVRSGQSNRNHGGGEFVRIQSSGDNRGLVRFNQSHIESVVGSGTVLSAKLELTIVDNGDNWGATGRTVDVHRLLVEWAEGNGTESDRGSGPGATWDCAIDNEILNQAKNCSGSTDWVMGQPNNPSVHPWAETATASQNITNGLTGVVEYDVTPDVLAFLAGDFENHGWLVKNTNEGQNGQVSFGTKESLFAPELVITYQP